MNKNLVKCKACGAEIAKNANTCPNCGRNRTFEKPGVWIGIIIWCAAILCLMKACSVF